MPDLALVDGAGVSATLSEVRGGRPAVVYFLRAATCPICLRHARALVALAEQGRLGDREVVLVVPGDAGEAARLAGRVSSPRVTTWASGKGHAAAGLGSFLALQHSGTFVLSADAAVDYRRTSVLPSARLAPDELVLLER